MTLPVLILYPHSRCNCRCVMCDIWKTTGAQEITVADLDRHAADIEALGVRWVVFSGGEPLMHSDLFRLCARLRELRIRLTVLSTGLLLEKNAQPLLDHVDEVIVSLDGPQSIHDRIRRVPGAFERMSAGARALHRIQPDFPVAARCTVQKQNCASLVETAQAARRMGLRSISFLAADLTSTAFNRPEGWTSDRQSEISLDVEQIRTLDREIEALTALNKDGFILESPEKLRRIAHHYRAHLGLAAPVAPRCNAPWVSAVVESDGTVRPCFFHEPIGSIAHQSLLEVAAGQRATQFRNALNVAENPICRRCVCSLYLPEADPALTIEQRTHAIQLLEDSQDEFLTAVESLTGAQWNFKPYPERWSIGEITEHVALAERLLFSRVRKAMAAKPNPDWEAKTAAKTAFLERVLVGRNNTANAPDVLTPKGSLSRAEIVTHFRAERAGTLAFIRETSLPLSEYTCEHPFPVFSTLNAYQWILYIALHNLRHNKQIAEVKAAAGYSK